MNDQEKSALAHDIEAAVSMVPEVSGVYPAAPLMARALHFGATVDQGDEGVRVRIAIGAHSDGSAVTGAVAARAAALRVCAEHGIEQECVTVAVSVVMVSESAAP
ncbi:MAG: hypothetical protein ACTII7_06580 [Galactobacter sp.]